jgi:hypothetical protein
MLLLPSMRVMVWLLMLMLGIAVTGCHGHHALSAVPAAAAAAAP